MRVYNEAREALKNTIDENKDQYADLSTLYEDALESFGEGLIYTGDCEEVLDEYGHFDALAAVEREFGGLHRKTAETVANYLISIYITQLVGEVQNAFKYDDIDDTETIEDIDEFIDNYRFERLG